jgi:xanthine dehydrogenase YagR molybdenum-binding subunit
MAVITAETLGIKPEDVTVKIGSTEYPWCGSSGGSTTTPSVAPAVRDASLQALKFLRTQAASELEIDAGDVMMENGRFFNKNNPEKGMTFQELMRTIRRERVFRGQCSGRSSKYAYNTFGAHFAEVEVDTGTGNIQVLKVVAVHEVGRIMNKLTAESQVIGGVTQGISTALFEERIMDEVTGNLVNPNLRDYKIATSLDIPEIIPLFVDMVDPYINILGTKGLGEPPRIPISAAIANAVYNAIGVHIREIPMTPDKVLRALKDKEAIS